MTTRTPIVTNKPPATKPIKLPPSLVPGVPRLLPFRIRSSALSVLNECPRKFLFQYLCGLFPRGEYVSALFVGDLFHRLWASLLGGKSPTEAKGLLAAHIKTTIDALQAQAKAGLLPDGRALSTVLHKLNSDIQLAVGMADWAWKHAPLPAVFTPIAVEKLVSADLRVYGLDADADCRVDVLLFASKPNRLYISDHKTSSQDPRVYSSVLSYQPQVQLYRLILATAMAHGTLLADLGLPPDTKLAGMSHSVLRKYTIRMKQNESGEDFAARVVAWYDEDPTARFVRSTINWTTEPLPRDFYHLLETSIGRTSYRPQSHDDAQMTDVFYRNPNACFGRFGNSPCSYLPLCTNPTHTWPVTIKDNYQFKDPTHKDEGDSDEA